MMPVVNPSIDGTGISYSLQGSEMSFHTDVVGHEVLLLLRRKKIYTTKNNKNH